MTLLALGVKWGLLRRQRIEERFRSGGRGGVVEEAVRRQQAGQGQRRKAAARFPEELAPRPAAELPGFVGMAHVGASPNPGR